MKILKMHPNFIMPTKGTLLAGAYDIYMPTAGIANKTPSFYGLGFAAEVPENHVALILPRSSVGAKYGLALNNTCGVIDSDYRGEWMASLVTNDIYPHQWQPGDRILQFLVVPVANITLELATELSDTARGSGGFGSSGK